MFAGNESHQEPLAGNATAEKMKGNDQRWRLLTPSSAAETTTPRPGSSPVGASLSGFASCSLSALYGFTQRYARGRIG